MLMASTLIIGCKNEVTCSSEETQALIKSSFLDTVITAEKADQTISGDNKTKLLTWINSNLSMSIANAQTIVNDKDTGAKQCKADLLISFESAVPNSGFAELSSNKENFTNFINGLPNIEGVKYENQKISKTLSYTTRMTDDNKKQMLELNNSGDFVSLVSLIATLNFIPVHPNNTENEGSRSFIGEISVFPNGNRSFEGYEITSGKISCKSMAEATEDIRYEDDNTVGFEIMMNKCPNAIEDLTGEGSTTNCIVTGTVEKSYGNSLKLTKITDAEEVDTPVFCN
jgi:hypothetical protein